MSDTTKMRTITLTDRPPVRIQEDAWPIIAEARDYAGGSRHQPTRSWDLRLRQHADGRRILYGTFTTLYDDEQNRRGGLLLTPGEDLGHAIGRVLFSIGYDGDDLPPLLLASMPAEPLD